MQEEEERVEKEALRLDIEERERLSREAMGTSVREEQKRLEEDGKSNAAKEPKPENFMLAAREESQMRVIRVWLFAFMFTVDSMERLFTKTGQNYPAPYAIVRVDGVVYGSTKAIVMTESRPFEYWNKYFYLQIMQSGTLDI